MPGQVMMRASTWTSAAWCRPIGRRAKFCRSAGMLVRALATARFGFGLGGFGCRPVNREGNFGGTQVGVMVWPELHSIVA